MYRMERQSTTGLWVVVDESTGKIVSRAEEPTTAINLAVSKGMPAENREALLVDSEMVLRQESEVAAVSAQGSNTASSGEVVREEQRAKSDDAATENPTPPAQVLAPQGRIDPNNVETGTDAPVVTTATSQQVPADFDFGPPVVNSESPEGRQPVVGGSAPGASAPNDDSGTRQNTARIINTSFNSGIKPQPNVLDQYASYTYNIAWYLMAPNAYKTLLNSARKSINGFQLLMQSGGAPATAAPTQPQNIAALPTGESSSVSNSSTAGRNPYFQNDYYIDNLEITNYFPGRGTNMSHNLADIKFTVTEPNGITLLGNLYRAVSDYYSKIGATGGAPGDYSNAEYCLVIRFYGYDDQGRLIQAGRDRNSAIDKRAVIEKFYPFHLQNITFRVANRQIEYAVTAKPIAYDIAFGSNRGVVPFPTEVSGRTLRDILIGKTSTVAGAPAGTAADTGRVDTNQAPQGTSTPNYSGDGRFDESDVPSPFQVGA